MATEILVNDGGAPARILPFTAGMALTGGRAVQLESDGTIGMADVDAAVVGVAFVDAASGANCSVISGKGVVLNVMCSGAFDAGHLLTSEVANLGILASGGTNAAIQGSGTGVAIALEDGPGGTDTGSKKVLIL